MPQEKIITDLRALNPEKGDLVLKLFEGGWMNLSIFEKFKPKYSEYQKPTDYTFQNFSIDVYPQSPGNLIQIPNLQKRLDPICVYGKAFYVAPPKKGNQIYEALTFHGFKKEADTLKKYNPQLFRQSLRR